MLTTFMALIMPLVALFALSVMNLGHVVHAKIRLQDAADRSAYAGAAKQAYIMNRMGENNQQIRKNVADLKLELSKNSKATIEQGRARVAQVRREIMKLWQEMEIWNRDAWEAVHQVSMDVAQANYGGAVLTPKAAGPLLTLLDRAETAQYQKLHFSSVGSEVIFEPVAHDDGEETLLSYLIKDPLHKVKWEVGLCAKVPALFLASTFDSAAKQLCAIAAAQPHGGSIRDGTAYSVSMIPVRGDYAH